ncbi:MAG: 4-phosphoerythronate dehydrogenase [Bacteroidales bacterium]|nr:4-phosphoerythronate dehydrogenase [Bacteroidales bacterium]MCD8393235.1 4-phosphoerythronate dehydrogenase [Bacteroidales bacterium]
MESHGLNIVVEANIPFIQGMLEDLGHVSYLPADEITPEAMRDVDALVTRTRTKCNPALLELSRCQLIATATIGTDHIDLPYCASRRIEVRNAPGCNAPGVAQWVLTSLMAMRPLEGTVLGIVGVGHVGKIVQRWAKGLGVKVLLCDPPRAREEGPSGFVSLDEIAREANVVTFHTPLTREGDDRTFHMADATFFAKCEQKPLIFNAARGAIVDTPALISALESGQVAGAAIDCWEGEPTINQRLLELAEIATPHIAGYSLEGKQRATLMAVAAVRGHFHASAHPGKVAALSGHLTSTQDPIHSLPPVADTVTVDALLASYDPRKDTAELKARPQTFESLRNQYHYRMEPIPSTGTNRYPR